MQLQATSTECDSYILHPLHLILRYPYFRGFHYIFHSLGGGSNTVFAPYSVNIYLIRVLSLFCSLFSTYFIPQEGGGGKVSSLLIQLIVSSMCYPYSAPYSVHTSFPRALH